MALNLKSINIFICTIDLLYRPAFTLVVKIRQMVSRYLYKLKFIHSFMFIRTNLNT